MKNLLRCINTLLPLAVGVGSLLLATPAAAQSGNLYDWAGLSRYGTAALLSAGPGQLPPNFTQPTGLAIT